MKAGRVAIVGSGLAGYAALRAIQSNSPETSITVFDIGKEPAAAPAGKSLESEDARRRYYAGIYRELKKNLTKRFPPTKSHFGEPLDKHSVPGGSQFARSNQLGQAIIQQAHCRTHSLDIKL